MQTLKQRLEQQKTAKKLKQLERTAKQPEKRLSQHRHKQAMVLKGKTALLWQRNRRAWVWHGKNDLAANPLTEPETCRQFHQDNLDAIEDLVYGRHIPESITTLEVAIRSAKIIAELIQDESPTCADDLRRAAEQAATELSAAQIPDLSPNQRRAGFRWIAHCSELTQIWQTTMTQKQTETIMLYNTGLQAAFYFIALYRLQPETVTAAIGVIRGQSLRHYAKQYNIKEPELRIQVLQAAKNLYRIGITQTDCAGITPAFSIPEMRHPTWQPLGDFDRLARTTANAVFEYIKPFTEHFGIDILGLSAYEKEIVSIQKKLLLT